jgi:hypothetical protein
MWNFSCVSRALPFLPIYNTSTVFSIVPYSCLVSKICWANLELCPLFFISRTCSLNLTLNVRPVCPTYLKGQSAHCNWYIPLNIIIIYNFTPHN